MLQSTLGDATVSVGIPPRAQQVIAFGKIPGEGFAFTTYKGYSFPENYLVEVELPDDLPNTPPGSKTQTMLVVTELAP